MLNLIAVEFSKLHRNKIVALILVSTIVMPAIGFIYFSSGSDEVPAMQFFKMTIFSYTSWLILPIILGVFSIMLVFEEKQNDVLKQLYIIPVRTGKLFISKFVLVLLLSLIYMIATFLVSYLAGVCTHLIVPGPDELRFVFVKSIQISLLTATAMIPIQCVAFIFDSYIFPVCATILYVFVGFILLMVNAYIHPISSMTAIWMKDVPGVTLNQVFSYPASVTCVLVWCVIFICLMNFILNKRK